MRMGAEDGRLARARAIRATVLVTVRHRGLPEGDPNTVRIGAIIIAYRNKSPYALEIWNREQKVFLMEWDDREWENIVIYEPGYWERILARL